MHSREVPLTGPEVTDPDIPTYIRRSLPATEGRSRPPTRLMTQTPRGGRGGEGYVWVSSDIGTGRDTEMIRINSDLMIGSGGRL